MAEVLLLHNPVSLIDDILQFSLVRWRLVLKTLAAQRYFRCSFSAQIDVAGRAASHSTQIELFALQYSAVSITMKSDSVPVRLDGIKCRLVFAAVQGYSFEQPY